MLSARAADPFAAADFSITTRGLNTNCPPIGANEFGDCGAMAYSAGNVIGDSGFEPVSLRRHWRVTAAGTNWVELDGGGMSTWDLTANGFLNGASYRLYRLVDSAGEPLPLTEEYLDLTQADRYVKVREGIVPATGSPGYPDGGWLQTHYTQVAPVSGTRANLSFTDAQWIENGHTYYYTVTALSDASSPGLDPQVESDRAAAEVSATPSNGIASGPRIYLASGDFLNEAPSFETHRWQAFRPRVVHASGQVIWALLTTNDTPWTPPADLTFNADNGELSGSPASNLPPTRVRWRVTADNGTDAREFILNNPAWTHGTDTNPPAPPRHVAAQAGPGFVRLTWDPSLSSNVVGYRIYKSIRPLTAQVDRIYLSGTGPAPQRWDYIFFNMRTNRSSAAWSHPRVRNVDGEFGDTWNAADDALPIALTREPHTPAPPPAMRFPGETCLRATLTNSGVQQLRGPVLFFPAIDNGEAQWYGQLEPGQTYRYEAWMRQSGLGDGGCVILTFNGMYAHLRGTVTVSGAWAHYAYDFVAPPRPTTDWHGCPIVEATGPGSLWIDNIKLYRYDSTNDWSADFVPSPAVFNELMASQPTNGPKGILRSMSVLLNQSSMAGNLSTHRDASCVLNWYQTVEGSSLMPLPHFLGYALRTGDSPSTRMKPWLNVSSMNSEDEWLALVEYLSAEINPLNPGDIAAKPYAYLRYQQRGVVTPWTEEFDRIMLEFANETWHNGAVSDQWFGWGRSDWVHDGSLEFGLFARFITDFIAAHTPRWTERDLARKLKFVMGSNYENYAELGRPSAPRVAILGHADYVGPKWETGDTPLSAFDDHGIQATLLGGIATDAEMDRYRRNREALLAQGHDYRIYGYEGGPSGYELSYTSEAQSQISERYGKSLAMGVAALDAWLGAYAQGWSEQGYLGFGQGGGWSSHAMMKDDYRRHCGWQALVLRNRHAQGGLVRVLRHSSPTIAWEDETHPLINVHAFRSGSRFSIFVLSRKLDGFHDGVDFGDGFTPVTLRLPANPAGSATLHRLAGNPRTNNLSSYAIQPTSSTVALTRNYTFNMPPGSIYLFTVDTDAAVGAAPDPVAGVALSYSNAFARITWTPSVGATGYRIYRSHQPAFHVQDCFEEFTSATTNFMDYDAGGGSVLYYRIAATNRYGESLPTEIACGGTNSLAPAIAATTLGAVLFDDAALHLAWTAVSNATGFRIGIATEAGGPYTWLDVGNATSFTLTDLTNGQAYFLTVQATNTAGRSALAGEKCAHPVAFGTTDELAVWDFNGYTSYETSSIPVSHNAALSPTVLRLGEGLITGDPGYHPMTNAFGFIPKDDNGNFGAPGGGSLVHSIGAGLYVGFRLNADAQRAFSLDRVEVTGLTYQPSNLFFALCYVVSNEPPTLAGPSAIPAPVWYEATNDTKISLAAIPALQNVCAPLDLRLYFFSPDEYSLWCRAFLRRNDGRGLRVWGQVHDTRSPPTLSLLQTHTARMTLRLARYYSASRLESATNLLQPAWQIEAAPRQTNGMFLDLEVAPTNGPKSFYRIGL